MKFTTPEDYRTLLESIESIGNGDKKPTPLTEAAVAPKKKNMFEAISDASDVPTTPSIGYSDVIAMKFNIEKK